MSEAPRTIRVAEDIGGVTVTVPLRPSGLQRHLIDKIGQLGLAILFIGFVLARFLAGPAAIIIIVLLIALGWGGKLYRDRLVAGKRQQLRVTPQRAIFPEGAVILEEVSALRLDLDRGRLLLHTDDEQVFAALGELDYAELIWLRDLLQQHIAQRREKLGDALKQPATVPEALQALRER